MEAVNSETKVIGIALNVSDIPAFLERARSSGAKLIDDVEITFNEKTVILSFDDFIRRVGLGGEGEADKGE